MALFDLGRRKWQILDFDFYLQIILFVVIFLIHQGKKKKKPATTFGIILTC